LLIAVLILIGCGGAGGASRGVGGPSAGTAEFTVVWPPPSDAKLIPMASTAVKLDVMQGANRVATAVAVKAPGGAPTTVKLESLPVGNLTVNAEAYPQASFDGDLPTVSGVPQAKGTAPMTTEAGKTAKITLTMASTVVRLAISPSPAQVQIGVDKRITLVATAYDAEDRVVLRLPEAQNQWSIADPAIAGVNSRIGTLEGFREGTTTVTVQDSENGKSATATLRVVKEATVDRVAVTPTTSNLESGGSATLTAKAFDTGNTDLGFGPERFTWTTSLPGVASVDATGKVTAGEVTEETSVTITATEPTSGKAATATVVVRPAREATGRIFYFSRTSIKSLKPDGTDHRVDEEYEGTKLPETISPDGTKLAYTVYDGNADTRWIEVWISNLDGSQPQRLHRFEWNPSTESFGLTPHSFAISRDNRRVAFIASDPVRRERLMVVSADGEPPREKFATDVSGGAIQAPVDLSPDGRRVSFRGFKGAQATIVSVGVWDTGSNQTQLIGEDVLNARFHPDGQRFLVTKRSPVDPLTDSYVAIMDANGTIGPEIVRGGFYGFDVDGDGKRIVYSRLDPGGFQFHMYVAKLDGSGETKIKSPPEDNLPETILVWSKP